MDEREREAEDALARRHEQHGDDEHREHVEEESEKRRREPERPLAGSVHDRVAEPLHLLVERRQGRVVRAELVVGLLNPVVALRVLGRTVAEAGELVEERRGDEPQDPDDERERRHVDHDHRDAAWDAEPPEVLGRRREGRREEDRDEHDQQDVRQLCERSERDPGEEREQQREVDRLRAVPDRLHPRQSRRSLGR